MTTPRDVSSDTGTDCVPDDPGGHVPNTNTADDGIPHSRPHSRGTVKAETPNECDEPSGIDTHGACKSAKFQEASGLVTQLQDLKQRLQELEQQIGGPDTEDHKKDTDSCADESPPTYGQKYDAKTNRQDKAMHPKRFRRPHAGRLNDHNVPLSLHSRYYRRGAFKQWDTSDSSDWSDDSVSSNDFRYYENRLVGQFEYEMNRLREQRLRSHRQRLRRYQRKLEAEEEGLAAEDNSTVEDEDIKQTRPDKEIQLPKHAISELNRSAWSVFKQAQVAKEHESFAVSVLVGEPDIVYSSYRARVPFGYSRRWEKSKQHNTTLVKKDLAQGQAALPERIRIRSKQLVHILSTIHGTDLRCESLVILRPFRMLIHYEKPLRDHYKVLEQRFDRKTSGVEEETAEVTEKTTPTNQDHLGSSAPGDPNASEHEEGGPMPDSAEMSDSDNDGNSAVAFRHLRCLLDFMDSDLALKQAYLNNPQSQKIVFSDIWHLFKPGDEVIANTGKQAYRVISVESSEHRAIFPWPNYDRSTSKSEETPITIRCVYVDFDGKTLGPVAKNFEIARFDGDRAITSLQIYPLRFHPFKNFESHVKNEKGAIETSHQALRCYLIERGRKFIQAAGVRHMYYTGLTLDARDEVESQVVVDFEEAFAAKEQEDWMPEIEQILGISTEQKDKELCDGDCCAGENVHDDSYVEKQRNEEFMANMIPESRDRLPSVAVFPRPLQAALPIENSLKDDDLVIMSYRVFGFVLRNRTWASLDLTHLTDIDKCGSDGTDANSDEKQAKRERTTAFDRLVLPPGHKDIVQSLISQHFHDKEAAAGQEEQVDIVRGKGKGLIILLHGAPGVGKTTTAEGVAELFQKPLFQITCGDLGSTAKEVEEALGRNFALASRWGCILLLDEADVFLAERRRNDFNRNGLVAVFLRVLEYYAGILFLTTNRIGDFDEAFASRIHISLHYPALDRQSTKDVFALNIAMIKARFAKKKRKIEVEEFGISDFITTYFDKNLSARWNGRQIRNACQTALALAEFDAQKSDCVILGAKHLEKVSNAYLEFMHYLKSVRDISMEEWAKEAGIRALEKDIEALNVGTKMADRTDRSFLGALGIQARMPPVVPKHPRQAQEYRRQTTNKVTRKASLAHQGGMCKQEDIQTLKRRDRLAEANTEEVRPNRDSKT
ncbi:hypothetical protein BHE90_010290 [Fusarium euwallaceae]|uniref:AAA+ ATPase domain-containing protein n=2 Tax=Fusarium solani species complex TaxID=232080 RepID=A0A3M2RRD1_9HYPO|nr:hypothetical protein CDV36_012648 [Fusarium kuroshium]RTE75261.1 hypothetical protein BHE90_010290 [Fusarium euwallaceae]